MANKYKSFHHLNIKELCSREMYGLFATYLSNIYKSSTTENITASTAIQYFNGLLNIANSMASKMAPDDSAARLFFTCRHTNSGSDESNWLLGLRTTIKRIFYKRYADNGETQDYSAPPIYLDPHIMSYVKAQSLQDTAASAKRKFSIQTLWAISGRAGETANLTFDLMCWDNALLCIFMEVPQVKTLKSKQIALVAGVNRHSCWFLALADHLVMQGLDSESEELDQSFLFPELQATLVPGTVLSNFLKMHALKNSASWPLEVSASSVRHGVCTWLALHMPAELAVFTTGHSLDGVGALWEYIDAMCKACIAGNQPPSPMYSDPPHSQVEGGWDT